MCGRYTYDDAGRKVGRDFDLYETRLQPDFTSWNLAPTQVAAIVHLEEGHHILAPMQWGLWPSWATDEYKTRPFNARSETLREKAMFRGLLKDRRCIVPMSGFYEWVGGSKKLPIYFHPADGDVWYAAGLWDTHETLDSDARTFCVITVAANSVVQPVHDRMPALLSLDDAREWLAASTKPHDAMNLLRPAPAEWMLSRPVGTRVNHVNNNDASLIAPVEQRSLFGAA